MTRRLATASSGGVGVGVPSRIAAAKRSASTVYGSAVGKVSVSVAGATGGSPPAVTNTSRRPVGRDVERDLDRQPPVRAVDVDALVGLHPGRAGERGDAVVELEDRAGQDVHAGRRIADDRRLTDRGSASNSIRDRLTE